MSLNLLELAKECPTLQISISVGELVEANNALIEKTKAQLEQVLTDANTETYPSVERTAEILDVNAVTLWRWAKRGYLVPINVGGKRRYKMSDIKKILGGDR